MDNHNIDDLLKVVSPALIQGYEGRNLDSVALHKVNEEYKRITQAVWIGIDGAAKLAIFSMFVGFALNVYLRIMDVPVYISFVSGVALCIPAYAYLVFFASPRCKRDTASKSDCLYVFSNFRQAVKELTPSNMAISYYTDGSVRSILVNLMIKLICAEKEVNDVCSRRSQYSTTWLAQCCHVELESRALYEMTLRAAEKFGLAFNKSEISADAEKILAKRNVV